MGGGCLEASESMEGCPYTCTHACASMHMYTCIEIANGYQHGGIHVYHV